MYEIEKNIPTPLDPKKPSKYPWKQMEVGDSFFVPYSDLPNGENSSCPKAGLGSVRNDLSSRKYTGRRVDNGWRIWRVA